MANQWLVNGELMAHDHVNHDGLMKLMAAIAGLTKNQIDGLNLG